MKMPVPILALIGAALFSGACATPSVLVARPLPVVLTPSTTPWDVSVHIEPSEMLHLRLVNNSNEPVSVLWEESTYIDVNNRSHPLVPTSSRQTKSTIAPGTRLEETLLPLAASEENPSDPLLSRTKRHLWNLGNGQQAPRIGSRVALNHPIIGDEIGLFLTLERSGEKKTLMARYTLEASQQP